MQNDVFYLFSIIKHLTVVNIRQMHISCWKYRGKLSCFQESES